MIDDIDIYCTTHLLIRQHDDDAAKHATRMDVMLAKGDLDERRVWWRVLLLIDVLQAKERPAGASVN